MSLKPCWKWIGGKGKLLPILDKYVELAIEHDVDRYAEPFVGGGALLWHILDIHDDVFKQFYIADINAEVINVYKVIQNNVIDLKSLLADFETEYLADDFDARAEMYYRKRDAYNQLLLTHHGIYYGNDAVLCAALFIFLNKTCFNGLYRVSSAGKFNAAHGRYEHPVICNAEALDDASDALRNHDVIINNDSYQDVAVFADSRTLLYMDPPYRPLTETANFVSYAKSRFNDSNQRELAEFCRKLDADGSLFMLSNSEPHNNDDNDDFFDNLYSGFDIHRISAARSVNRDGKGRGKIPELLITNFG